MALLEVPNLDSVGFDNCFLSAIPLFVVIPVVRARLSFVESKVVLLYLCDWIKLSDPSLLVLLLAVAATPLFRFDLSVPLAMDALSVALVVETPVPCRFRGWGLDDAASFFYVVRPYFLEPAELGSLRLWAVWGQLDRFVISPPTALDPARPRLLTVLSVFCAVAGI